MSNPQNSHNQNSIVVITVIAFLLMGFVTVVALIFRPSGAIKMQFGEPGPHLSIGDATPGNQSSSKNQ